MPWGQSHAARGCWSSTWDTGPSKTQNPKHLQVFSSSLPPHFEDFSHSLCPPRLSAGLLRQATYTTTRLGIYSVLLERFGGADGTPPPFVAKAAMGMTAGAAGAFVGTPAEVALIRMTADGR